MFYIACRNGFVKDFNGRLVYTVDIRRAKPFETWDDAEDFAQGTALVGFYYAILCTPEWED